MKTYIKFLAAFLILLTGACGDLLEKTPESSISPEQFYRNSDDAKAAISSIYDLLNTGNMYAQFMWVVSDQSVDDAEWGGGRNTANPPKNELDKYTFTPSTTTFSGVWSACYQGINRANTAIARIPAITMDEDLKARLISEAKFMRAFYYFTLVRLFGGVPLVVKETTSLANLKQPRASVDEVYQQIVSDFTDAETVLPVTYGAADRGRATKGAAKAFLAKVYLTREQWANASTKAKEVMDLNVYDLWANFADAFVIANKNGKEAVFEMQALSGGFGEGSFMSGYMRPNLSPADPAFRVNGFGDNPPTKNLYDAYSSGDARRDATLRVYPYLTNPPVPPQAASSIAFPCWVRKYYDVAATANADGGNNFPLIRYPDVLLMYAEALNEQSANNTEAYNAINKVRNRAGLANLTSPLTQEQFRDSVLLERRLELAFEGHRRYDLLRTRRLISAMNAQNPSINVQPHHYLFPIPQIERDVNPNLEQNDGY
jgi:hypothetical protein